MKKIVVVTGAGMSADSGIATFRDGADGLWANYRIEDVCTPEALMRNRKTVIEFYNERRKELLAAKPNAGHIALAELGKVQDVQIITQNIDDLHERAGSRYVLHLHGELRKLRSTRNDDAVIPIEGWEQKLDARHPDGSLLRPHVVFFGEAVPNFEKAVAIAQTAEIIVVVGTSMVVYPAAALLRYVDSKIPVWLIDPGNPDTVGLSQKITHIKERAAVGVPKLVEQLKKL